MTYKRIIRAIAKNHNISAKEADKEIRTALKASGINSSPEPVIELAVSKFKKDYIS